VSDIHMISVDGKYAFHTDFSKSVLSCFLKCQKAVSKKKIAQSTFNKEVRCNLDSVAPRLIDSL
jgi:hypothetical protein